MYVRFRGRGSEPILIRKDSGARCLTSLLHHYPAQTVCYKDEWPILGLQLHVSWQTRNGLEDIPAPNALLIAVDSTNLTQKTRFQLAIY